MSFSASANKTEDAGWQSTEDTMFSSHPLNVSRLSSNFIAELKCCVPVLKTIKYKSFIEILLGARGRAPPRGTHTFTIG